MPLRLRRPRAPGPRAIIDIGSNTVRLVIYGGPLRAPVVLHNEKVTARLGKGVAETGVMSDKARDLALSSLARYHALLRLRGVDDVTVVATAASRDASNGTDFLDRIRRLGLHPRLLSGEEEALTSAHGVIGAFPGAKGIVGDLGGGSLELVEIDGDSATHGVSLPLGTLGLPGLRARHPRGFQSEVDRLLNGAEWRARPGTVLYLVGGSLRAFARFAMNQTRPVIDDPHGFELDPAHALKLAKPLARSAGDTLTPMPGISNSRLASLPDTAALLVALIVHLQPEKLVFSAWGLREGLLWEAMPAAVRQQHPLVVGASAYAEEHGVAPAMATMVAGWTAGIAPHGGGDERLRQAATLLCLASSTVEPNLRTDLARDWALRKRWIGASSFDRAMLAVAMIANTGRTDVPAGIAALLPPEAQRQAQAWGLATRLCRRFTGGSAAALGGSALGIDGDNLVLRVSDPVRVLVNDGVQRDCKALAQTLGLRAALA